MADLSDVPVEAPDHDQARDVLNDLQHSEELGELLDDEPLDWLDLLRAARDLVERRDDVALQALARAYARLVVQAGERMGYDMTDDDDG